jgi:hypothetical protein
MDGLWSCFDSGGNQRVTPYPGKFFRLLEPEEKIMETSFFYESRRMYPVWFCVDPVASLNTGANVGLAYFDGSVRLRWTPSARTFNAGYQLNVVLYKYKTVTIEHGNMIAQMSNCCEKQLIVRDY